MTLYLIKKRPAISIPFNGKTYNNISEMPATEGQMDEKLEQWEEMQI
jgi:hypothetical protein